MAAPGRLAAITHHHHCWVTDTASGIADPPDRLEREGVGLLRIDPEVVERLCGLRGR